MSDDLRRLIDEAIKLELNMAELYLSFHNRFPEDAGFWWKLAIEEKNHASLLKNGKQYFLDDGMFPSELVGESLEALVNMNSAMEGIHRREIESPPLERILTFQLALKLEESAGEVHFQHAIQQAENPSDAIKLFQSLNENDKNHAERISRYMRKNGME